MKITIEKLKERIDELEKQVRELQARPVYVPVFPPSYPVNPLPVNPLPVYPIQPCPATWPGDGPWQPSSGTIIYGQGNIQLLQ